MLMEKVFLGHLASNYVVITQFGYYGKLSSKPSTLPIGLALHISYPVLSFDNK